MMKYTVAILLWLCTVSLSAQQTFTEKLQQAVETAGRIILHQDVSITDLVNGKKKQQNAAPSGRRQDDLTASFADSVAVDSLSLGPKIKINGYRIQVYAGGNNRQSKAEAHRMASLVRATFSDVPVYTSFKSPRWVCQVGDFRTREEAHEQLQKMRATQQFGEASIVKSKIAVYY